MTKIFPFDHLENSENQNFDGVLLFKVQKMDSLEKSSSCDCCLIQEIHLELKSKYLNEQDVEFSGIIRLSSHSWIPFMIVASFFNVKKSIKAKLAIHNKFCANSKLVCEFLSVSSSEILDLKDLMNSSAAYNCSCVSTPPISPKAVHNADTPPNEIHLDKIISGDDKRTTCMIRNIPNKYTQKMLFDFLNETHRHTFDFLYLRIDFKNKCNVGYAFINFVRPQFIISVCKRVQGQKWPKFNSEKRGCVSYARIQGRQALIEKFRNSSVMDAMPDYRPKLFYTDGPKAGQEQEFPPKQR